MRRLLLSILWLTGLWLTGCSSWLSPAPKPSGLLDTPLGPVLEPLWRAHGGLEAWRRYGRVRFQFAVSGAPVAGLEQSREMAFPLGAWDELKLGKKGEERSFDLRGWSAGEGEDEDSAKPSDHSREGGMDYFLRSARFFFHLPFFLSLPGWEFRQDLFRGAGEREEACGFWAIPAALPAPHAGYYIVTNPETGLLKSVTYQVTHPRFQGKLFEARFQRYEKIGGIQVATEIRHRAVRPAPPRFEPPPVRPFDPFLSDQERAELALQSDDWILRFEAIQLIPLEEITPHEDDGKR
ncbi:MAG: hypothetical protein HY717_00155 [Planctomycetes bacterium]|nr:hypothetical protein [Planctomycetota bacterium]